MALLQDVRYSVRILRRSPGFTAVAALTLALGIGTNTAVFSVINGLLIRSLPFPNSKELVLISNSDGTGGPSGVTSRAFSYRDLRRYNHSFSDMAAYNAFSPYLTFNLTGQGAPERLLGMAVTGNFFPVLGVAPAIGRNFLPEECVRTGRQAVILANGFWMTRFASNPNIVGQTLTIDGAPMLVAGVMPATFDFPSVFTPGARVDLFTPHFIDQESENDGNEVTIIGRLKPGVTLASAQADMTALAARLSAQETWGFGAHVKALDDYVTGKLRKSLLVLAGAVCFVLLIACVNLSNLLLARATSRRKELALRLAIGADRFQLVRQMLAESIVLSFVGAILALPLAFIGTRMLAGLRGTSLPMLGQIQVDQRALLFTFVLSLLTGLIFGILPALRASRCDFNDALKEGTAGAGGGHRDWTRSILVVSEVALSFMLLGGAGLMMKSLFKLLETDLGFRPDHIAIVRVDPGPQMSDDKKLIPFLDRVSEAARGIPGVEAAAITDAVPLDRDRSWGAGVIGQDYKKDEYPIAFVRVVGPDYFRTMRIPLLKGRSFDAHDNADSEHVIVINESMARRLFRAGEDPLGHFIRVHKQSRIIGVVGDVRHSGLDQESGFEFYIPYAQGDIESGDLVVRTTLPPDTLATALRRTIWSFAPNQPLSDFRTLDDLVDSAASSRRFTMVLLVIFAIVALALASVGIYGVISYSVAQRTREMGIRMALGADAGRLKWQVVRQAVSLAVVGAVLGVGGLLMLSKFLEAMLYQVTPTDPATFGVVSAVLIGVALIAGYIPARRAARISPMMALRFE